MVSFPFIIFYIIYSFGTVTLWPLSLSSVTHSVYLLHIIETKLSSNLLFYLSRWSREDVGIVYLCTRGAHILSISWSNDLTTGCWFSMFHKKVSFFNDSNINHKIIQYPLKFIITISLYYHHYLTSNLLFSRINIKQKYP